MKINFNVKAPQSFFLKFSSIIYLLALVVLSCGAFWPRPIWWIANLISVAPLWLLIIPAAAALIYGSFSKHKIVIYLNGISIFIIFFGLMGWNVPASTWFQPKNKESLTIMSVNLGEKARMSLLREEIKRRDADVILFQESGDWVMKFFKELPTNEWGSAFHSGFGIISRFKIIDVNVLAGNRPNASGTFMVEYLLEGPHGALHLFNVHLETPRKGLKPLLDVGPQALDEMINVTDSQETESYHASNWVAQGRNVIVAGDFNLTSLNPIFRTYWSSYQDTFSKAGWGFGNTKHTRWHGVRIDHILVDEGWQVLESGVGPNLGGDHRPVYAKLAFIGKPKVKALPKQPDLNISSEDAYYQNDFGSTAIGAGKLTLPLAEWPMETYPKVRFTYKIAPQLPLIVRVLTPYNDWICLAGTASAICPHAKSNEYGVLTDDGAWHVGEINVDTSVKSVLKALEGIRELQFVVPEGQAAMGEFWVGNFVISK